MFEGFNMQQYSILAFLYLVIIAKIDADIQKENSQSFSCQKYTYFGEENDTSSADLSYRKVSKIPNLQLPNKKRLSKDYLVSQESFENEAGKEFLARSLVGNDQKQMPINDITIITRAYKPPNQDFAFNLKDNSDELLNSVKESVFAFDQKKSKVDSSKLFEGLTISNNTNIFYPAEESKRTQENCYIVQYTLNEKVTKDEVAKFFQHLKGTIRQNMNSGINGEAFAIICFEDGVFPLKLLKSVSWINFIERDTVIHHNQTQNNPPWDLDRIDQTNLPLNKQYNFNRTGKDVHVYVVDSGIYLQHPEINGRAFPGKSFVEDEKDCSGHGTQIASVIGGTNTGVAKLAKLYSVKVLNCKGEGRNQDLYAAMNWVIENHEKPAIVNLSVGGPKSIAIDKAIEIAHNAGIIVVCAAGNQSDDACNYSPSGSNMSINVGSYDQSDQIAIFSNWGKCVDIFAPGVDVVAGTSRFASKKLYIRSNGTSLSAPIISGIAAQFLEENPALKPEEVRTKVVNSAASNVLVQNFENDSPNRSAQVPENIGQTPEKIQFFKIDYDATWHPEVNFVWGWVVFGVILLIVVLIIVGVMVQTLRS